MMNGMNVLKDARKMTIFLLLFYIVGLVGLLVPASRELFTQLTPFTLLLSAFLLYLHHKGRFKGKVLLVFAFIFVASIVVEMIGVQTGVIFGSYKYGDGLGLKIMDTPVLIGLNWLLLIYLTANLVQKTVLPVLFRVPVAALLMVVYDMVMEQVAPKMDMWSWADNRVPFANYVAWFALSLLFHGLLEWSGLKIKNRLAAPLLAIQFVFFVILLIWM